MSKYLQHERERMPQFARGVVDLARAVREINPHQVIYTIRGAVPIADCLRIADPAISGFESEYLPASSVIADRVKIIREWFGAFLDETHIKGERQRVVTIDESLSGSSVIATTRQIRNGIFDYCKKSDIPIDEIDYISLCLEDRRKAHKGVPFQATYNLLKERGVVRAIEVEENLVMDAPHLCPIELAVSSKEGHRVSYLPIMASYNQSSTYLDFLELFGNQIGQRSSTTQLQNPVAIRHSERFVPERYKVSIPREE